MEFLKKNLVILLTFLSTTVFGEEVYKVKKVSLSGVEYLQFLHASVDFQSAAYKKFTFVQKIVNPQSEFPNMHMTHLALDLQGKREFLKSYHTNQFGFRVNQINKKAKKHLILAGDSHIFGQGCNDNETLAAQLSKKFPDYQLINLGISGSAGNSLLFSIDHFKINSMFDKRLEEGLLIYDFSDYLIERMIGSKEFIKWGWMQPSYGIDSTGKLVYLGPYHSLWATKFYKLINAIDPYGYFIKNLPRIGQNHLELVADIFLELKKKYLFQTKSTNKFYIQLNPFFINLSSRDLIQKLLGEFEKRGIEVLTIEGFIPSKHYVYPIDKHITPEGHQYYADLISKALRPIIGL